MSVCEKRISTRAADVVFRGTEIKRIPFSRQSPARDRFFNYRWKQLSARARGWTLLKHTIDTTRVRSASGQHGPGSNPSGGRERSRRRSYDAVGCAGADRNLPAPVTAGSIRQNRTRLLRRPSLLAAAFAVGATAGGSRIAERAGSNRCNRSEKQQKCCARRNRVAKPQDMLLPQHPWQITIPCARNNPGTHSALSQVPHYRRHHHGKSRPDVVSMNRPCLTPFVAIRPCARS